MARYYCKNCHCEIRLTDENDEGTGGAIECPFCLSYAEFGAIPDYETPEQYEKRTGEKLSIHAAVWYRISLKDIPVWNITAYGRMKQRKGTPGFDIVTFVVASGPNPPPDDFKPKEK